jgi:hypothetical protein
MNASATASFRVLAALLVLSAAPAWAQRGVDPAFAGAGAGIVEVAHPSGDPCDDLTTPGCIEYGGNTVWHDGNVNADYYVSAGGGSGELARLSRYVASAMPEEYEMRFTPDGGLAWYAFVAAPDPAIITEVPFEIWNIGDADDPGDDVRMIPFINANATPLTSWEDQFTGADTWPLGGSTPITDWVYWMMPDRPNGYDLFEAAALAFGGPGAAYDTSGAAAGSGADGDDQVDPSPLGGDCPNQGAYVDWCYRLDLAAPGDQALGFVYPVGRMVIADLAGDGTTPASGTVIRLITDDGATTFASWADNGAGIVETDHPSGDPCADPGEPGCEAFGGNTVWHDSNVNADYYVSAGGGAGDLSRISRYVEAAIPDAYEMRFTPDGGLAWYAFVAAPDPAIITEVPFEIWNIGDADDPGDDVRMIPFINANATPLTSWEDQFTGADTWSITAGTPITDWVYWMMPDRPNGYDLFEAAALAFGGPGAAYDTSGAAAGSGADGDDQVDPDPTGGTCDNQGAYVDWCFRLDRLTTPGDQALDFVYPIGRLVFADLAGDGTTPASGTVIRFFSEGEFVPPANEDDPTAPEAYALLPVAPNPFATRAAVPFLTPQAGAVRVAVYDLLGREVAVLADGRYPAGRHEVSLDGARLASGVYVVVLEADGARTTRKVTLLR